MEQEGAAKMIALSRQPISVARAAGTRLLRWKWAVGMPAVFALCMLACTPQEVMELQLAGGINGLRTER